MVKYTYLVKIDKKKLVVTIIHKIEATNEEQIINMEIKVIRCSRNIIASSNAT
ncbi:hypothetical protein Amet_1061 [Alkaliphilus metalliredigens QYMF]|uniref:Uncharacterized protein n=1 Tax=Alkaliphilus metalliredigens (strain QYMF) TaxID=293826 RepID=A6TM55_ALKMQ|nr:hypothetical protein [Alkaliphilus metalliredigens]ABR47273.1 hypothetical protein Amet_1061 [Alkaliphilus metalliredigens QYMF]